MFLVCYEDPTQYIAASHPAEKQKENAEIVVPCTAIMLPSAHNKASTSDIYKEATKNDKWGGGGGGTGRTLATQAGVLGYDSGDFQPFTFLCFLRGKSFYN